MDVTIHNSLCITCFKIRAVIFHHIVRVEDVAANLTPPLYLFLGLFDVLYLRHFLFFLELVELRFKHLHRVGFILPLRTLILALYDDTGRGVSDTYGGFDFIDVLTTSSSSAVSVYFQIAWIDFDLDIIVHDRAHVNSSERRVTFFIRVER